MRFGIVQLAVRSDLSVISGSTYTLTGHFRPGGLLGSRRVLIRVGILVVSDPAVVRSGHSSDHALGVHQILQRRFHGHPEALEGLDVLAEEFDPSSVVVGS